MASISSLLKSAAAARSRIRAQEDAIVAYNWENSAQTYDDFVEYQKYLTDRADDPDVDPSDALSYQTKLRAARRSYTSNELQRQQMAIMEGRASTQDKMNKVRELYDQAIENGDMNLAQNLVSQWDSLSIQLQNEQEKSMKAYANALAAKSSAIEDLEKDLKSGFEDVTLPTGETRTPLSLIKERITEDGDPLAALQAAKETIESLEGIVLDRWNNATTQEELDKLQKDYGVNLTGFYDKVFLELPGAGKVTHPEIVSALVNDKINNPIFGVGYNAETGKWSVKRNNVETSTYARVDQATADEMRLAGKVTFEIDGEFYVQANTRTNKDDLFFGDQTTRSINTLLTDKGAVVDKDGNFMGGTMNTEDIGKRMAELKKAGFSDEQIKRLLDDAEQHSKSQTIGDRLKELGIIAKQEGTGLKVTLPGENVERTAYIDDSRNLRYVDERGVVREVALYDQQTGYVLDENGRVRVDKDGNPVFRTLKAGESRDVNPDEASDFGTSSKWGGSLSKASARGERYISDMTGRSAIVDRGADINRGRLTGMSQPAISGAIRTGNDFAGHGTALTSSLLQSASMQRQQIILQKQRDMMLQAHQRQLQASQFNINQTPIAQMTQDGTHIKQLRAVNAAPAPRVVVAPPVAAPKVTVGKPLAPTHRVYVQPRTYTASNRPTF